MVLVLFAGFFSLYSAGASWGNGYQNPLFVESLCFGKAHIDTLYHVTISNMLRSYGVVSTGLDGLPFTPYHFGSHWLFAAASNLLHVRVIDFYNRGYPVVFVPFGMFSLATLALAIGFRSVRRRNDFPSASGLGHGTSRVGPLCDRIPAADWTSLLVRHGGRFYRFGALRRRRHAGVGMNVNVVSESYGLSVAVSLLTIAVGWQFSGVFLTRDPRRIFRDGRCDHCAGGLGRTDRSFEISIMPMLGAAGLFLVIRLRVYRRASVIALLVLRQSRWACPSAIHYRSRLWSGQPVHSLRFSAWERRAAMVAVLLGHFLRLGLGLRCSTVWSVCER